MRRRKLAASLLLGTALWGISGVTGVSGVTGNTGVTDVIGVGGIAFADSQTAASDSQSAASAPELVKEAPVYHYVALGDSLTVGYEPGKSTSALPFGFVDRVYEQALMMGKAQLVNYGIGGLTSEGLLHLVTAVVKGSSIHAEDIQPNLPDPRAEQLAENLNRLKPALQSADLITITIGGNDFIHLPDQIKGKTDAEAQQWVSDLLNSYQAHLSAALDLLHGINPSAEIVIADQYQAYPDIDHAMYQKLESFKDAFSQTLDWVAATQALQLRPVKAVHVAPLFVGNELAYTHIGDGDIHPNQLGYDQMARKFASVIWGGYRELPQNDPIGVVLEGKPLSETNAPVLINGSAYVPIRALTDAVSGQVQWDQSTQTATLIVRGRKIGNGAEESIRFQVGSDQANVNGSDVPLNGSVQLIHSKTYVPLRKAAGLLGLDVEYVSQNNMVFVNP